jgi:hypothetical protein
MCCPWGGGWGDGEGTVCCWGDDEGLAVGLAVGLVGSRTRTSMWLCVLEAMLW